MTERIEKETPLLGPDEIQALISSVAPEDALGTVIETLPPLDEPKVVNTLSIDELGSEGLDHYPPFIKLHESLSELIRTKWLESITDNCAIEPLRVKKKTFREFVEEEEKYVFFAYESPLYGRFMVAVETHLLIAFVDALLGGKGESLREPPCVISRVELKLSEHIARQVAEYVDGVWHDATGKNIEAEAYKIDPNFQFLSVAPKKAIYVGVIYPIRLGSLQGELGIYYPQTFVDPLVKELDASGDAMGEFPDPEWARSLEQELAKVPVTVALRVGHVRMTMREFLEIQEGDLLHLGADEHDEMELFIEGVAKYTAIAGQKDGMLAAEIVGRI